MNTTLRIYGDPPAGQVGEREVRRETETAIAHLFDCPDFWVFGETGYHAVHFDQFKPEIADPLHEPEEGRLIGHLGAKGRPARASDDRAVIKHSAQGVTRFPGEGDLIDAFGRTSVTSPAVR